MVLDIPADALRRPVDDLVHYFARHWLQGTAPDPEKVACYVKQLVEPKLVAEIALLRAELEAVRGPKPSRDGDRSDP